MNQAEKLGSPGKLYNKPMRDVKDPISLPAGSTAALLLLAAIAGAWGGFQYASVQEVPCCAKADITPITYTVLGASVAATHRLIQF